jgi:putative transposase
MVYHVLNRSAGKTKLFRTDADYTAFLKVMAEAYEREPTRILSFCLLSTHWHFVVWPRKDGELTAFFRRLTHIHAMRWRVAHHTVGYGHLYQGRFKSFVIQKDEHLRTVCRYVERNPLGAGLVKRAEDWRWSSMHVREHGPKELRELLTDWPVERPRNWTAYVNEPLSPRELLQVETSLERSRPFGDDKWVGRTVASLGLEHTVRREGRPAKAEKPSSKGAATGAR